MLFFFNHKVGYYTDMLDGGEPENGWGKSQAFGFRIQIYVFVTFL
jgi:hypothetical protein